MDSTKCKHNEVHKDQVPHSACFKEKDTVREPHIPAFSTSGFFSSTFVAIAENICIKTKKLEQHFRGVEASSKNQERHRSCIFPMFGYSMKNPA